MLGRIGSRCEVWHDDTLPAHHGGSGRIGLQLSDGGADRRQELGRQPSGGTELHTAAATLHQEDSASGRRKDLLADQNEVIENVLQGGAAEDEIHDALLALQKIFQAVLV
jgi:hypothetical protein